MNRMNNLVIVCFEKANAYFSLFCKINYNLLFLLFFTLKPNMVYCWLTSEYRITLRILNINEIVIKTYINKDTKC